MVQLYSAASPFTPAITAFVTPNADGTWTYDEDTVLMIRGRDEPFHHTDRNTLTRVEAPTPNPLKR